MISISATLLLTAISLFFSNQTPVAIVLALFGALAAVAYYTTKDIK
jgi:hypothetical protein